MKKKLNYNIIFIHSVYWVFEFGFSSWLSFDPWRFVLFYPLYIVVFYLNYFILIPRMIRKPSLKSILTWFLVFFILYTTRRFISNLIGYYYFQPWGLIDVFEGVFDPFLVWKDIILGLIGNSCAVLAVTWGSIYNINKFKLQQLERRKIKNELNTLKNQIDIPETINILSKLEQISKVNPEVIQEQIIQLSSVLRHHLYSKDGEIILSKELEVVINQLRLYNKLNNSELKLINRVSEQNIKTGILSKAIGEVLKHTKKVKSKLELVEFLGNTCLKVSDSNLDVLKEIKERVQKKFSNQLSIQTISQSILIQLN